MKIITYNINGIRAALNKGFLTWLQATQADVVCLQEVKALASQIPIALFEQLGYEFYLHTAEKKGYSGTAILTKKTPKSVSKGYTLPHTTPQTPWKDTEGRLIRADFNQLSVLCVYIPSGTSGQTRQDFKMLWLEHFYQYIQELKKHIPNLVIVGDYNIAHQPIDIHNPKANIKSSGFLPEERQWFSNFLELGFIDTFRYLNPEPHNYTWWSSRSPNTRAKNLGWRIDYQLISHSLIPNLKRAVLLKEAYHSDHCPVLVEMNV
ncbi:MAG: exodeoxyribonuclease III [Microscillaceae bacterium]|nr:exodeoxyribonuclease III [Microscillaceae bacterium]MDW8460530.1 exodeoxyribonuclease III [Cytophagales bacterium]